MIKGVLYTGIWWRCVRRSPWQAPHTLIVGETGSGKGMLTQNLLLQMIAMNSPDKL